MSDRVTALRELGFGVAVRGNEAHFSCEAELQDSFSGYGEFTPISITTRTELQHADLERSKSRNRTE